MHRTLLCSLLDFQMTETVEPFLSILSLLEAAPSPWLSLPLSTYITHFSWLIVATPSLEVLNGFYWAYTSPRAYCHFSARSCCCHDPCRWWKKWTKAQRGKCSWFIIKTLETKQQRVQRTVLSGTANNPPQTQVGKGCLSMILNQRQLSLIENHTWPKHRNTKLRNKEHRMPTQITPWPNQNRHKKLSKVRAWQLRQRWNGLLSLIILYRHYRKWI